jgi:hypothetical protein
VIPNEYLYYYFTTTSIVMRFDASSNPRRPEAISCWRPRAASDADAAAEPDHAAKLWTGAVHPYLLNQAD